MRELENAIKRLLVLSPDGVISAEDAENAIEKIRGGGNPEKDAGGGAERLLRAMLEDADLSSRNVHREIIGGLEKKLIEIVLDGTGGNAKRAAEILGINRNTLSRKMGGSQ